MTSTSSAASFFFFASCEMVILERLLRLKTNLAMENLGSVPSLVAVRVSVAKSILLVVSSGENRRLSLVWADNEKAHTNNKVSVKMAF